MVDRSRLSPGEKYLGFKKAHDTFSAYRGRGEYLAAFVLAFSIFEDRVMSCYQLAHDMSGQKRPAGHAVHYKKVRFLAAAGLIAKDQADAWRKAGDGRNHILHAAMWAPDTVTDVDCAAAIALAKDAERMVKRLKSSLKARSRNEP